MSEADSPTARTVDVRVATEQATNYLRSLAPYVGGKVNDVRLEEVELSEDEQFWFVTLGFDRPIDNNPLALLQNQTQRDYKQFKIDALTGEVKAMKIRTV